MITMILEQKNPVRMKISQTTIIHIITRSVEMPCQMTCVAGLSTHLALGTSTGTVFWYDRWATARITQ